LDITRPKVKRQFESAKWFERKKGKENTTCQNGFAPNVEKRRILRAEGRAKKNTSFARDASTAAWYGYLKRPIAQLIRLDSDNVKR
jgi:hypothetical protein